MKDDLKKCGLDGGLAKDRERWNSKLSGKRPTCASTDKGRKTRREREREGERGRKREIINSKEGRTN